MLVAAVAALAAVAILAPVSPPAAAASAPAATPAPTGEFGDGPAGGAGLQPTGPSPAATPVPGGVVSTVRNITTIIHQLEFPFSTMMDGIVKMVGDMARQSYSAVGQVFTDTIQSLVFGEFGIAPESADPPLFRDLIYPHWQVMFSLALLLMPLTLALSAASALRQGAASTLGFADLKESLVGWLVSVGGASASYYLLGLFYRLSVSAALAMAQANFGDGGLTSAGLQRALFSVAAVQLLTTAVPIVGFTLGLFILFLVSSILIGLALGLAAFAALIYVLTTLAPVLLVLGSLKPLEWLKALWLKVVVIVLLLPVTDVLLLKAAASLAARVLNGGRSWGTVLGGVCLAAGVLSILITMNFKVAELVFGAIGEVGRNAVDSTLGVARLVASAAGLGLGFGLAGAAGAVSAVGSAGAVGGLPSPAAGNLGSTGPGAAAAGSVGTGSAADASLAGTGAATRTPGSLSAAVGGSGGSGPGASAPAYPAAAARQAREARARESIGRVLARTRNPLLQGLGRGLEVGAASASARAGAELDDYAVAQHAAADQRYELGQARQAQMDRERADDRSLRETRFAQSQVERVDDRAHRMQREQQGDERQARMDRERAADKVAREQAQAEREELQRRREVLGWSQRTGKSLPAEGFAVGRPVNTLMEGALHHAMMEAGYATNLEDVRAVSDAFYGAWQARYADQDADKRFALWANVMSNEGAAQAGAHRMLEEMTSLAQSQGFAVSRDLEAAVQRLYARAVPMVRRGGSGPEPVATKL